MKREHKSAYKKIMSRLRKSKDFIYVHNEWKMQAKIFSKVIKSRVLSKNEAKELVHIFGGNTCQYRYGDLMYADKLEKELDKIMEKTYKGEKNA